ncbi:DUF4185 domain-containing protein [bacterium]|nr:MAG: DUF4185 domain-containing protein [bacterium]
MQAHTSLRVAAVRDLGPQFTQNPHQMIGQDGAYSIPMGSQTLWFFGDTLIGKRVPGESLWYPGGKPVGHSDMSGKGTIRRMLNNTGLLLADHDASHGLRSYRYLCDAGGELRCLIPLDETEDPDWDRIWCLHGIAPGKRMILSFIKVRMLEDGPFPVNFDIVGSGLAAGSADSLTFTRIERNGSSILWGASDPHFASTFLHDAGSRMVYAYGARHDGAGGQDCYIARVAAESVDDPDAYEYLVTPAPDWSRDVSRAIPALSGMPNELSVSYNKHLGCYLAVHSFLLSGEIVGRTAPHPWGPWSEPVTLWKVKPVREKPLPYPPLVYAGKEHPELGRDDGRVLYLTYVEFEEYFPHLIEVTIA